MVEHLGNAKEICWFAMEMADQLEAHKNEKQPIREWDYEDVEELVTQEVKKRINIIDFSVDPKEIEKQCIHIANYVMMLFVRSKYNV